MEAPLQQFLVAGWSLKTRISNDRDYYSIFCVVTKTYPGDSLGE